MEKRVSETFTEMEIKKLIQQEIKQCFEELSSDVRDIKQALLGNDYHKGGLVVMVQRHDDYIEKSEALHIIDRSKPALEWYEGWEKNKNFEKISEVLDAYSKGKWFVGLIAGGSLAGMISVAITVVELIKRIS